MQQLIHIHIHSYREARGPKQVPEERYVLSAKHSLHEMITSLLGIFMLVTQHPFGVMALAWACLECSVYLSAGACPTFVASTEGKIGLVHHLRGGVMAI